MNRRMFLRGAGGFALALPFLPSLLPRSAWALSYSAPRRFVCMTTEHGGVWTSNLYPNVKALTDTSTIAGGHEIRKGTLSRIASGGVASLSPCLTAADSVLTDAIVGKMTVIRGVDVPWYLSHHTGGYLGNFARNDGEFGYSPPVTEYRPTIDQVLAWSDKFYPDLSQILQRSVHVGDDGDRAITWGWSNPSAQTGVVIPTPSYGSSLDLFDATFRPPSTGEVRAPAVDHVLEAYLRLRDGAFGPARQLSAADKVRLDEHIERLYELERKLTAVVDCGDVIPPTENADWSHPGAGGYSTLPDESAAYYELWNEVLAAAFRCDTCRIVTIKSTERFSTFSGDWHQDVAHMAHEDPMQEVMLEAQRLFFEEVFLDLCQRLDVEEADGRTYLDNSVVMWNQEAGSMTHDQWSMPVVLAGSAGGWLQTGQYVDYRDLANEALVLPWFTHPEQVALRPGLTYNQLLGTLLQAMGLDPADYERAGESGYGDPYIDPTYAAGYSAAVLAQTGEPLPFLKA